MTTATASDFDFLLGTWSVKHHRLTERLRGSTEWQSADATDDVVKILLGRGNLGRFTREFDGAPYEGISIRLFDEADRVWRIYWIDTISMKVDPPVTGFFESGIGTFIGDDTWEGTPIRVRFIWSDITADSARWEQAYSTDSGETWEVNSIMEFKR